jgi:hypothetical protein
MLGLLTSTIGCLVKLLSLMLDVWALVVGQLVIDFPNLLLEGGSLILVAVRNILPLVMGFVEVFLRFGLYCTGAVLDTRLLELEWGLGVCVIILGYSVFLLEASVSLAGVFRGNGLLKSGVCCFIWILDLLLV